MADEQEFSSFRGRFRGGVLNLGKRVLERMGVKRFHYYRTAKLELVPTKEMRLYRELLTKKLGELGKEKGIEDNFGYIVDKIKPEVDKVYQKLGQYIDTDLIEMERKIGASGTGEKTVKMKILDYKDPYPVKITGDKEIIFPDGFIQRITVYGYTRSSDYWIKHYTEVVNKIFLDAKNHYEQLCDQKHPDNRKVKDTVNEQLEALRQRYLQVLKELMTGKTEGSLGFLSIYQRDKVSETDWSKLRQEAAERLKTLRNELFERLPENKGNILYKHTYLVVMPCYYDDKNLVDLKESDLPIRRGDGEFEVGKDEYGMPFEVADDDYTFDGRDIPKGTILLDVFLNRPNPRRITKYEFLKELHLHEIVSYAINAWDEYRDDFRDGRYHKNSLTVIDYIMASNKALGGEWSTSLRPWSISDSYKRYNMKLGNGQNINFVRAPTNLNPAFDLRAMEKAKGTEWLHIGKPRYYGDTSTVRNTHPDPAKERDFAPHISSRGLSMFIIEHICRKGKSIREIQEDLRYVAKKTGGYDYGPRRFGKGFTKDPFNINTDEVNQALSEGRD